MAEEEEEEAGLEVEEEDPKLRVFCPLQRVYVRCEHQHGDSDVLGRRKRVVYKILKSYRKFQHF